MVLVLPSDNMLTCPLDESHRIRKERMQFHLVKCLKNHKLQSKIKCPYNPLHIIDKFSWEHHWKNECENMPAAMEFQFGSLCNPEEPKDVASIPIITDNSLMPPCDEDWDAEAYTGTYDPFESAGNKLVFRTKIGLSKAKKKEWRQEERRRHQEIEANGPLPFDKLHNAPQQNVSLNRKPRSKPLACSADTSMLSELNMSKQSEEGNKSKGQETPRLRRPHTPGKALVLAAHTEKPKNTANASYAAAASSSMTNENRSKTCTILQKPRDIANESHSDAESMMSYANRSNHQHTNVRSIRKMTNKSSSTAGAADETEDELIEHLAHLTTMEMSIKSEKAAIFGQIQMNKMIPNLIDPECSVGPSFQGSEGAFSTGRVSPMPNLTIGTPGKAFINPIPRCAAAFSGVKKKIPDVGAGRGRSYDLSVYKKHSPGKDVRSYADSTTSLEDVDSVFSCADDED